MYRSLSQSRGDTLQPCSRWLSLLLRFFQVLWVIFLLVLEYPGFCLRIPGFLLQSFGQGWASVISLPLDQFPDRYESAPRLVYFFIYLERCRDWGRCFFILYLAGVLG